MIDVGANKGQYAKSLRNVGFKGIIHSFEPASEPFAELEKAASRDKKWHAHHMALGESEGEMELNVMHGSVFNSFLQPNAYAKSKLASEVPVQKKERVRVYRLDAIWDSLEKGDTENKEHNVLLKMDTQGFDMKVFRGSHGILDRVIALQSELSITPIYEGMPDFLQSITEYVNHGFTPSGIYTVSRDKDSLLLIELDCIMLRNRL